MAYMQIDQALGQPSAARGEALIAATEDQYFDRKSIRVQPKDLAKTEVAFANAEGGTIVVGLHNGVVEGTDTQPDRVNDLRQAAINFTDPPVRTVCELVECLRAGSIDHLLTIRVAPGEVIHRLSDGDVFLRVGDESRRLNYAQERELLYDKGQTQYDGEAVRDAHVNDLSAEHLADYAAVIGVEGSDRVLNARNLLTPRGKVTNAAYLLFAEQPQGRFPEAVVRVIKYLHPNRGTGQRQSMAEGEDIRISGPLPQMIHSAQHELDRLMPRRRALNEDGKFDSIPLIPRDAWLEGLVNAVVHRSYSAAGDHIRVEIFPDRIEIESPGRFPGLVNLSRPQAISRFSRNPRIARVCSDLRITQELGEGIRRIYEEMRRAGLEEPLYRQTQGTVKLILSSSLALDDEVSRSLPKGAGDVLSLLQFADRPLGTGDVQAALDIARPTALRRLNALRDAGLIHWRGKSPQDPRAAWYVTDER